MKSTEKPTLKFNFYGKTYTLYFALNFYEADKSIAVMSYSVEDDIEEPFANITVCIPSPCGIGKDRAYIDTNNLPDIDNALVKAGFAKPTGTYKQSGYVSYPEYQFSRRFLNAVDPEMYERYLRANGFN